MLHIRTRTLTKHTYLCVTADTHTVTCTHRHTRKHARTHERMRTRAHTHPPTRTSSSVLPSISAAIWGRLSRPYFSHTRTKVVKSLQTQHVARARTHKTAAPTAKFRFEAAISHSCRLILVQDTPSKSWGITRMGQNHVSMRARCTYCIFSREIAIHTVIYGVCIRFRPNLGVNKCMTS
jgi:hypothetical protein